MVEDQFVIIWLAVAYLFLGIIFTLWYRKDVVKEPMSLMMLLLMVIFWPIPAVIGLYVFLEHTRL